MKVTYLIILIFLITKLKSQTYRSTYLAKNSLNLKGVTQIDSIKEGNEKDIIKLFTEGKFMIESKIKIVSNNNYAMVYQTIIKSNHPYISVDSLQDEKYFINFLTNTIYNLDKRLYYSYLPYSLKNKGLTSFVIDKKDTAIVTLDKNIPSAIKANLNIINNKFGVRKIETKNIIMTLDKIEKVNFNLENCLIQFKKVCVKDGGTYNFLFN